MADETRAFGYWQSRWGYRSEDDVREVVKAYRDLQIPLDSVYLDIDYMERYKDFTLNQETFPDFPDFVEEMKKENIHLVPIIDAGVKEEKGYPVYDEGEDTSCKKLKKIVLPFSVSKYVGNVEFNHIIQDAKVVMKNKKLKHDSIQVLFNFLGKDNV